MKNVLLLLLCFHICTATFYSHAQNTSNEQNLKKKDNCCAGIEQKLTDYQSNNPIKFVGKGTFLNERSLEIAIGVNTKSNLPTYHNIYSSVDLQLNCQKATSTSSEIFKEISSIKGIIELVYISGTDTLTIIVQKENSSDLLMTIKQTLASKGIRISSKKENTIQLK